MEILVTRTTVHTAIIDAESIEQVQAWLDTDCKEADALHDKLDKGYYSCETATEVL